MIPAKRIAGVLLAIAIAVATLASRQATHDRRSHAAHGCQAAGPGGAVATFEADVAGPVHQTPSTPGMSARAGGAVMPAAHGRSIHSAFSFARPHDPPHLHAFSLLI